MKFNIQVSKTKATMPFLFFFATLMVLAFIFAFAKFTFGFTNETEIQFIRFSWICASLSGMVSSLFFLKQNWKSVSDFILYSTFTMFFFVTMFLAGVISSVLIK
jgi:hypothetical protein